MIKKNYFVLSLIFMFFLLPINLFGQVSVKITDMSHANGTPISDKGPIKISSGQDTRILFTVSITRPESQVMNGNLFIYSKRNSSSTPIVLGNAQYISSSSWSTTISIPKDVTLSPAEYDNSGGLLYAEFESIGGSTYKSDNWTIQKDTGNTPPPPPSVSYPTVNTISASYQAGNGFIPIIKNRNSVSGSNTINVSTNSEFDISMYVEYIIPANFDCSATPVALMLYKQKGNNTPIVLKNVIGPSYMDQSPNCGGLRNYGTTYKLTKNDLSEGDFKVFIGITYGSIKAKSAIITISPKSVPLISGNSFDAGGEQEIIIGSKAEQIGHSSAPRHSDRILGTANATFSYQWQKKINNEWTNISGANSLNYSPGVINDFLSEYRRIAISSLFSITHISITATITAILVNDNNIICCDQKVISGQVPQKLIGSTPQGIGSFTYEWEKKTRTQWNVVGTSKDYAPDAATLGSRPRTTSHYYRRKVIPGNGSTIIYSNEVKITISPSSSSSKMASEYQDISTEHNFENVEVYPNPSSNFITVNSPYKLLDSKVKIFDQQGVLMNNYNLDFNETTLNIDIENLNKGIYILIIESSNNETITKKIIKK